jgi:hypothetical protein
MRVATLAALTLFGCLFAADLAGAADGGLRLTGRALVAVPQKDFTVFLTWRHREDIPVQMPDGSVRVYVNTKTPSGRKPCKWQDRAYQMLQAPGDYRYFIRTLYGPQGP